MVTRPTKRGNPLAAGVTPLLDTLFLLLFALLVASDTRRSTHSEAVRIRLPAVEPAGPGEGLASERVALAIDAESRLWLAPDGEPIASRAALDALLAERLGERLPEELVVEIRADARSASGTSLALLQHLLLRGFTKVELIARGVDVAPDAPFGAMPEAPADGPGESR